VVWDLWFLCNKADYAINWIWLLFQISTIQLSRLCNKLPRQARLSEQKQTVSMHKWTRRLPAS